jgi:multiple sugar transport system permease protein
VFCAAPQLFKDNDKMTRVASPSRQRLSRYRRAEMIAGYVCIAPWFITFLVLTAGAMLAGLALAFFETDLLSEFRFVALGNFGNLFKDPLYSKSLVNTAYYTFTTVPLSVASAFIIALILNQGVWGQGIFRTIYYLPSVVSGVAVTIIWIWLFSPNNGLINAFLAMFGVSPGPRWFYSPEWAMPGLIIMSLWGVGAPMLIYLAGLQGIPREMYEAARIDGAGSFKCLTNITIPLMTPTIFFNLIMGIIGSFQVFTSAFIATNGGPNNATLTMVLYLYRKGFQQFRFGYASAIAWSLFLIIIAFTALVFRSSSAWVYYESELRK